MQARRVLGAVIILLLLASIVSSIYLTFDSKISQTGSTLNFKNINLSAKPNIGVIDISGQIYASGQDGGLVGSGASLTSILQNLQSFAQDDKIKAVIISINSPGGTVGAVQEIVAEIEDVKRSGKPVVASVADIAASGGYYIASACDKIVANPGSIVGSIGVIIVSADMSRLLDKIGVSMEIVKSGPYKDAGAFHRPLSKEEKKFMNALVTDAYEQFVSAVSRGRKIPIEEVKNFSEGQLFTGRMAADKNIVDILGGMNVAKKVAEEMAGIEDSVLVRKGTPGWKQILRVFNSGVSIDGILAAKDRFTGIAYMYRQ